jgi:hypothetical protein
LAIGVAPSERNGRGGGPPQDRQVVTSVAGGSSDDMRSPTPDVGGRMWTMVSLSEMTMVSLAEIRMDL